MITNFFKSGFSSLESIPLLASMQGGQVSKNQAQAAALQLESIVQETLKALHTSLGEQLGENIDNQTLKSLTSDVLKSKGLEASLIETKEKYNDLVNKSTALYGQAKKIGHSIAQFISSINMFLQSDELLAPLNEIQKAINDLLPEKVEKQVNYLIKIFANNFQQIIDKNVKMTEKKMGEEMKLLKNLNKNLQNEMLNIKNNKNNDESKYLQQAMKIAALNEKLGKLNSEKGQLQKELRQNVSALQEKQKQINEYENDIKRWRQREADLLDKVRQAELKSLQVDKQAKEQSNEAQALNLFVDKLKANQDQMMEELQSEFKKKEAGHELLRKKLTHQKATLQEKVERLTENIHALESQLQTQMQHNKELRAELTNSKRQGTFELDFKETPASELQANDQHKVSTADKKQEETDNKGPESKQKLTFKDVKARIEALQGRNEELLAVLEGERTSSVNKQVLKGLFLSYDDESKEWAVRRNIKYQIYSLLDLKDKVPKAAEPSASKWFGLF